MTPAQIGQLVRRTRRAQRLRQDQLAGAAGVGVRFLVELEAGKATAQLGKALAALGFADPLDVAGSRGRLRMLISHRVNSP